ncbi:MAG: hypothetical protein JWR84_876 [Caulobacter sp.]|nr:hypothetical protein [Caulobacter sp.]
MAVVGMVMATLLVLTITVVVLLNRPREPKVEPVQQYATRLTRVRDKPTAISSVILGDIRRGDAVVGTWVVGEDGQTPWLKIKWGQGGEAYAWGNNLSPDTPPPIIRETTESRSVLAPTALYAAPRVDAAQIDDLPTGAKVELAGELAAGWYEVARKQGGVGYIQATAFVRPAPANEVATPAGAVVAPANDHSTAVGMRPDAQICSRLSPGVAYEFHSIGWNLNEGWFASDTSRPKDAVRYANANSYDVTVQYYFVPPNAPCPP